MKYVQIFTRACFFKPNFTQERIFYALTKYTKTINSAKKLKSTLLPLCYPILPKMTPLFTHLIQKIQIKFYFSQKIELKKAQNCNKTKKQFYEPTIYPSLENLREQRLARLKITVQGKLDLAT